MEIINPRGNNLELLIELIDEDGELFPLGDGDCLVFTVKQRTDRKAQTVLRKRLTAADYDLEGNFVLKLSPEDTVSMSENGKYFYDIAVRLDGGSEFYTVIIAENFKVLPALSEYTD